MNDPARSALPHRLLLATDLCARCDRPLDRARQLALAWQADLSVLMVRESPGTPEEVASWLDGGSGVHAFEVAARAELAAEFAGSGVSATLQVAHGDVTAGILAAAAALPDALVVIGASRDESFQQLLLGSTAARLAQGLVQPLLVVRRRTRGPYGRIVVANDFGAASMRALDTAVRLFPECRITLLHVLDGAEEHGATPDAAALEAGQRFLDRCALPEGARARIDLALGHGAVTAAIAAHAAEHHVELVVLGIRRYSAMARVFIGSRSDELLQQLPCDTLLVRALEDGADG